MLDKIIRMKSMSEGDRYASLIKLSEHQRQRIWSLCGGLRNTDCGSMKLCKVIRDIDLREVKQRYWKYEQLSARRALKEATGQDRVDLLREIQLIEEELLLCNSNRIN